MLSEFFEYIETPEDFMCSVCLNVHVNPVQTECGHRFCKLCIGSVIKNTKKCPLDNLPLKESCIYVDRCAEKEINNLKVRCIRGDCGHVCTVEKADEHECAFEDTKCVCGEWVIRSELSTHEEECRMRKVKCQHCDELIEYWFMEEHIGNCDMVPVDCPFLCGEKTTLRNLENHEKSECLEAEHDCPCKDEGCTFRGKRKDIAEHVQNEVYEHIRLIKTGVQEKINTLNSSIERTNLESMQPESKALSWKGSLVWTLKNVGDLKNKKMLHSEPFYTASLPGYKFLVRLMFGENVGIFFHICKGMFDDEITWPFCGKVTFTLIDLNGGRNAVETVEVSGNLVSCRRPTTDRNTRGMGFENFVSSLEPYARRDKVILIIDVV